MNYIATEELSPFQFFTVIFVNNFEGYVPQQQVPVLAPAPLASPVYHQQQQNNKLCSHNQDRYYSRGLCSQCYKKQFCSNRPWNCSHDRLYANGLCRQCYLREYNKKQRLRRLQAKTIS